MSAPEVHRTLPAHDYHDSAVFEVERERIFFRQWFHVGREEQIAEPGSYLAADVAGEGVLVVRTRDGQLRAFYNVCRHRGSQLCDAGQGRFKGAIKCPYHAWSYSFHGELIGTPNVARDEVDRSSLGLRAVAAESWQGFLFVNLGKEPPPLRDSLIDQIDSPIRLERFHMDELRVARRTVTEVRANWKILIENYNECLHCPTVHPELVQVVPAFRKGGVYEDGRDDGGVSLAGGGTSFTRSGTSEIPVMPGLTAVDATSLFGCQVFPNIFLDITGSGAISTNLAPRAADHTTVTMEYLFRPEVIADPGFDPTEIVEFSELVGGQDYAVCERVQRGVGSRGFQQGVYAGKDGLLHRFNERYLAERGPVAS